MAILERNLQINKELDGSIFLFGARQTGKSTVLRQQFPNSIK
jgi:predicted AAA+ superfamily ATPase